MSQRQVISYTATDEQSGKEVVALEFRRGLMNEGDVLADEAELLNFFINFIQKAQASAGK